MRHKIAGRKFNRTSGERKALFLNLAKSLLTHEQIKTTLPKAKDLRPIVERIVTKARNTSLHTRRHLIAQLRDPALVDKLMSNVAPRFTNRAGGYTRILKAGFRYGDNAPMAIIEFVDFDPSAPKPEVSTTQA
jgi:large subunit ribosomal protein L17